jgi:hypothetical protein
MLMAVRAAGGRLVGRLAHLALAGLVLGWVIELVLEPNVQHRAVMVSCSTLPSPLVQGLGVLSVRYMCVQLMNSCALWAFVGVQAGSSLNLSAAAAAAAASGGTLHVYVAVLGCKSQVALLTHTNPCHAGIVAVQYRSALRAACLQCK